MIVDELDRSYRQLHLHYPHYYHFFNYSDNIGRYTFPQQRQTNISVGHPMFSHLFEIQSAIENFNGPFRPRLYGRCTFAFVHSVQNFGNCILLNELPLKNQQEILGILSVTAPYRTITLSPSVGRRSAEKSQRIFSSE